MSDFHNHGGRFGGKVVQIRQQSRLNTRVGIVQDFLWGSVPDKSQFQTCRLTFFGQNEVSEVLAQSTVPHDANASGGTAGHVAGIQDVGQVLRLKQDCKEEYAGGNGVGTGNGWQRGVEVKGVVLVYLV